MVASDFIINGTQHPDIIDSFKLINYKSLD